DHALGEAEEPEPLGVEIADGPDVEHRADREAHHAVGGEPAHVALDRLTLLAGREEGAGERSQAAGETHAALLRNAVSPRSSAAWKSRSKRSGANGSAWARSTAGSKLCVSKKRIASVRPSTS